MREAFETFEQFCLEKKQNVILEEHFTEDGAHYILCRHQDKCTVANCPSIRRLMQQTNRIKTFQK